MIKGSIPNRGNRVFSSSNCSDQIWSPQSILISGHWHPFILVAAPGHVDNHSPRSGADIKNEWSYYFCFSYMLQWYGQGKLFCFFFLCFFCCPTPTPTPTWPCPTPQYKVHKWTRQSQVTMLLTEIHIDVGTQNILLEETTNKEQVKNYRTLVMKNSVRVESAKSCQCHHICSGIFLALHRATMCKGLACKWHGLLVGTSIPCHLHITYMLD